MARFYDGPAFIDPNSERVKASLLEAFETTVDDPVAELVLGWYDDINGACFRLVVQTIRRFHGIFSGVG